MTVPYQVVPASSATAIGAASVPIDGCRCCGERHLRTVLELGAIPLANRLLTRAEFDLPEPRFPLELVFCPRCTLAQITETVAPEILFRQYPYCSSVSEELLAHSKRHVHELIRTRHLGADSLVVELASNDGYLLQYFVQAGVPALGIEPALNVAAIAEQRGVPTRTEFFTAALARSLRAEGIQADVVIGNNVLAHVADLNGFVHGAAEILAPGGIIRFEFPYVANLVDGTQFDTIYHEHLCYFSAHAIEHLANRHDLTLADVAHVPVHGGSLRVMLAREAAPEGRKRVEMLLTEERRRGMEGLPYYTQLGERVARLREDLTALLKSLKQNGARIVGYGASAKGAILLNYMGLGRDVLDYVVDRSSVKQGWFTPGTRLEILEPERLLDDRPEYALLLAWNFADEILRQQAPYRAVGGRFIIPIPAVTIV